MLSLSSSATTIFLPEMLLPLLDKGLKESQGQDQVHPQSIY
jgi:hypothetical protein